MRRWILESVLIQNTTKKIDYLLISVCLLRASLVAQIVKNLPAIQETLVWSLGWEDPLEKGMAAHSSILAGRIPWTEGLGGLHYMESQRIRHNWGIHTHTHTCMCLLKKKIWTMNFLLEKASSLPRSLS